MMYETPTVILCASPFSPSAARIGVAWQVADLSISLMDDPRRSPRRFAVAHPWDWSP